MTKSDKCLAIVVMCPILRDSVLGLGATPKVLAIKERLSHVTMLKVLPPGA